MGNDTSFMNKMNILHDGSLGDLLIVIDMQNVYLEGQPWECVSTCHILKNIQELIDNHVPDNVIFTKFIPPENPKGTWKQYTLKNKNIHSDLWLGDIIDELKRYLHIYPLFLKDKYSAYTNKDVATLATNAKRVLLSGVVAECCVLFTLLDGIDAGNKMVYLKDACSGANYEHEKTIEKIAQYFRTTHTQVMSCKEYIKEKIHTR